MIHINPKVPVELKGCRAFGFKTNTHFNERKRFRNVTMPDQLEMNKVIGEMKTAIEQFQMLPCEISATVGFENGHQIMEGEINVLDQSSIKKSEEILEQIDVLSFEASCHFRNCTFSITITQAVTITNRYKMNEFLNS